MPTRADSKSRCLAELIARQRAGIDPRPRELTDLRRRMLELERTWAQARSRRDVAEPIHDALSEQVAEREAHLEQEWRRLMQRPDIHGVVVTAESVIIELEATEQHHCRFVHLTPDAPIRAISMSGADIRLPLGVQRMLARSLASGNLCDLVDRFAESPVHRSRNPALPPRPSPSNIDAVVAVLLRPWLWRLDEARTEVMTAQADSDRLERAWREAVQQEAVLSREIARYPHPALVMADEDLTIFERVLSLPNVVDADVVSDALLVETTPIEIVEGGERYRLGCFRLRLHVPSWQIEVRAETMHNAFHIDHPHISRGIPCFGSHAGYVRSLWQRTDLAGLVRFLLVFLESYNAAGAYLPISAWPLVIGAKGEVAGCATC